MTKSIRKPSQVCVDCGEACWGRTRHGKQPVPRCHSCANRNKDNRAQCGTEGGWKRHRAAGETPCDPCRLAVRVRMQEYRDSRKARGMLAQKRRTDRVYRNPEDFTYPDCVVCGESVRNPYVRSNTPMHKACNPRRRWIAISRRDRLAIYERDDSICQLCHGPVDLSLPWTDRWSATLDHIVPYSLGGADDPSNLRLAHRSCNSRRGVTLV